MKHFLGINLIVLHSTVRAYKSLYSNRPDSPPTARVCLARLAYSLWKIGMYNRNSLKMAAVIVTMTNDVSVQMAY